MMNSCTAPEFVRRWPGSLRRTDVSEPRPVLPKHCRQQLTEFGLPRELMISCYNDMKLTFSGATTALEAIWERDLGRGSQLREMPSDWSRFWHLADQEYTQGGGWICIEEISGRLVVIDLDLDDPIYLFNSSVSTFYTTLAHFLEWSESAAGSPGEAALLRDELRRQKCVPVDELEPFWMNVVETTLDSDSAHLRVELGRQHEDWESIPERTRM